MILKDNQMIFEIKKHLKTQIKIIYHDENYRYLGLPYCQDAKTFNEDLIWFVLKSICYKDKLFIYRFHSTSDGDCQLSIINKKLYIKTHVENDTLDNLYKNKAYIRSHSDYMNCRVKDFASMCLASINPTNKLLKFELEIMQLYLWSIQHKLSADQLIRYKKYMEMFSSFDFVWTNNIIVKPVTK